MRTQPILQRLSVVLMASLFLLTAGFVGPIYAQTTQVTQPAIRPMGAVVLPHPALTMQRILDWRNLGLPIPRRVYSGAMMAAMTLNKMVPDLQNLTGMQLIDQFPQVLQKMGLGLQSPTGVSFWQYRRFQIMVYSVKVNEQRLRSWFEPLLEARQGKLLFAPAQGPIRQVYIQSPTGQKSPIGLQTQHWLHVLLPRTVNRRSIPKRLIFPILQQIHQSYPNILPAVFRRILTRDLRYALQQKDADLIAGLDESWLIQNLAREPEFAATVARWRHVLPRIYAVLSLKQGVAFRLSLGWKQMIPALFSLWKPNPTATDWSQWIPSSLGWFGLMYINHLAIPNLIEDARQKGILTPTAYAQLMKSWDRAKTEATKRGVDLVALLQSWRGEYGAGLLWHDALVQSLTQNNTPRQAVLKATFALLGFRDTSGATGFLRTLQTLWTHLAKENPRDAAEVKISSVTLAPHLGGVSGISIQVPKFAPVYLIAYQNLVLFAGHVDTVQRFVQVWTHKTLSAAELRTRKIQEGTVAQDFAGQTEFIASLASQKGYFVLLPRVVRDLQAFLLPAHHQQRFSPLMQRFHSLSFNTRIVQKHYTTALDLRIAPTTLVSSEALQQRQQQIQTWQGTNAPSAKLTNALGIALGVGISPTFLSDPMYAGVLAAIAIPAFIRYMNLAKTSEVRVNLRALRAGAVSWFDGNHSDAQGNPLPKHFPNFDKGWTCFPKTKPCAHGHARYPANPSGWQTEPWITLKFGPNTPHYFQYCYQSTGTGKHAKFVIRAHADLNCNGVLSTYELHGSISPYTGEVQTSQKNSLPFE